MRYRSERDGWVAIPWFASVLMIVLGLGLGAAFLLLPQPPAPLALVAPALVVLGVLMLWMVGSAWYEISDTDVVARVGPFRKRVPLRDIVAVDPDAGPFRPAWGFALSLRRIHITYRTGSGRVALLGLAVSPAGRAEFLEELRQARASVG